MLGLPTGPALIITTLILLFYVTLGGAHADILTDSVQGAVMVAIAIGVAVMFFAGFGLEGGPTEVMSRLTELDSQNTQLFNPAALIVATPWAIAAIVIAHIPMGMLPHLGNKLWALVSTESRRRFLLLAFCFAMILPAVT